MLYIRILLLTSMVISQFCHTQEPLNPENEAALKSAYLVNIAGLVTWQNQSILRLCLSDKAAVYPYLKDLKKIVLSRNRELQLLVNPVLLDNCHLLYVDAHSESVLPPIPGSALISLMTITDIPGSLGHGYSMQFFWRDLQLRFAIDRKLVESSSYKVSSKLMRMSRRLDQ